MIKIAIELTDQEYKAMGAEILEGAESWAIHMVKNRARQAMDSIIERETTHRAKALSHEEKAELIRPMKLETAKDRNARELAEMEAKIKAATDPTGRT